MSLSTHRKLLTCKTAAILEWEKGKMIGIVRQKSKLL